MLVLVRLHESLRGRGVPYKFWTYWFAKRTTSRETVDWGVAGNDVIAGATANMDGRSLINPI